jgi:hypothetical protein
MDIINKDKLPLKYYFEIYNKLENFPTNEDILYELSSNKYIIKGTEFNLDKIKNILSFKINEDQYNSFIKEYNEIIEEIENENYKLIKNIWK